MKKLMSLMLGMGLALGTMTLFAQDKPTDKTEAPKTKGKKKGTKKNKTDKPTDKTATDKK